MLVKKCTTRKKKKLQMKSTIFLTFWCETKRKLRKWIHTGNASLPSFFTQTGFCADAWKSSADLITADVFWQEQQVFMQDFRENISKGHLVMDAAKSLNLSLVHRFALWRSKMQLCIRTLCWLDITALFPAASGCLGRFVLSEVCQIRSLTPQCISVHLGGLLCIT